MKETIRTTISLPKALYEKALLKVDELHYSTFSDYVQHLLRQEVADLLPEGDPAAYQLAEKNPALSIEALNEAYKKAIENLKYPKASNPRRKQAVPKDKQN